jgi:hypothetical protein
MRDDGNPHGHDGACSDWNDLDGDWNGGHGCIASGARRGEKDDDDDTSAGSAAIRPRRQ